MASEIVIGIYLWNICWTGKSRYVLCVPCHLRLSTNGDTVTLDFLPQDKCFETLQYFGSFAALMKER